MTEFKGTPGPWCSIESSVWSSDPYDKESLYVAETFTGINNEDDARLISAAPELLEALQEMLKDAVVTQRNMLNASKHDDSWKGCAEAIQPRIDKARAAIAKALGESE